MFTIFYSNNAEKFIRHCGEKIKARIKELSILLQSDPIPSNDYDLRKIGGEKDTYRIRLSSFRVTYHVDFDERVIRILQIERRDESTYKRK